MSQVFDVAGMIVVLAIIATIVTSRNSATVIKAIGNTFSGSIKAAKG
jgi:hypothetical protein